MDRHKCKLCFKTFANGRGLGGHLKDHLASVPLHPEAEHPQSGYGSESTDPSLSFFSSGEEDVDESEGEEEVERHVQGEEKALVYALRENPKKSFRIADPEFSFAVDVDGVAVVHERESETESKNQTRKRTKRNRGTPSTVTMDISEAKEINGNMKLKKSRMEKGNFSESPSEPEPVSSVSYSSPEEDVAMCLMILSRDTWSRSTEDLELEVQTFEKKRRGRKDDPNSKRIRGKHQCENCRKTFRSYRALNSHKKICFHDDDALAGNINHKIFECPFCFQQFGSGQALGGHKRSHLIGLSSITAAPTCFKNKKTLLDLNLPAPAEEDDFSVVSES